MTETTAQENVVAAGGEPPPVKRGRGRPRKDPLPAGTSGTVTRVRRVPNLKPRRSSFAPRLSADDQRRLEWLASESRDPQGKPLTVSRWCEVQVLAGIDRQDVVTIGYRAFSGRETGDFHVSRSAELSGFRLGGAIGDLCLWVILSARAASALPAVERVMFWPIARRFVLDNEGDLPELASWLAGKHGDEEAREKFELARGLVADWFNRQPELASLDAFATLGGLSFEPWPL